MRFKQYLDNSDIIEQHLSENILPDEAKEFSNRWKSKLKAFGVTEFDFSKHHKLRLNDTRNKPPIKIGEMDHVLNGFLRKYGSQFKKDVENVKNHTAKKRGLNKKQIPDNEYEFTVKSNSNKINFVFVLKQDFHKKGTAIVLPMTVMRKKNFKTTKGDEIIVERREL